ncbi:tripartite tricarboxylate transporter TctB family protein [uncultured Bilophila sp.]|uniref:tripartite tricarboxylate transporter TctB family protein n=1 Tax=uncultured Bilophila sp. TaxID=529385 RepID=UPI00280B320F|nr:tripartite tricarboxylate transporter TctB family protein [uncultured Bilophila sp.]
MLYKEFISALVMTGIVVAFAIPMAQLSGESQVVPLLLLICMGIFNIGQYILAGLRYAAKIDVKMSMKGYPFRRVAVLFALTILYLLFLETIGFYIDALLYFIAASLIAQPMRITPKLAAKRVAVCFISIAFLYCLFTVLLAVQIPKGVFGI